MTDKTNKDGLAPGSKVTPEQLVRVQLEHRNAARRSREQRTKREPERADKGIHTADKPKPKDTPKPASSKKTKESGSGRIN